MPDDNTAEVPTGLTVGEGGTLNEAQAQFIQQHFKSALAEEYRGDPGLADYKDLNGFTKSHLNQAKLVGKETLGAKPKTKEEWNELNRKLGKPVDVAGYELSPYETATDADKEWFAKFAHEELELSKRQANAFWKELNTKRAEAKKEIDLKTSTKLQEGLDALVAEIGSKEKYAETLKATDKNLNEVDSDGRFKKFMAETGLNKHPEMQRFAIKVARLFAQDRTATGERTAMPTSKVQAEQELNKIFSESQRDPKHPLMNKRDPAHADMVKKITRLADIAGEKE